MNVRWSGAHTCRRGWSPASAHTDYELRAEPWRVFYRYRIEPGRVLVTLIGEKRGEKLLVDGEEVKL